MRYNHAVSIWIVSRPAPVVVCLLEDERDSGLFPVPGHQLRNEAALLHICLRGAEPCVGARGVDVDVDTSELDLELANESGIVARLSFILCP